MVVQTFTTELIGLHVLPNLVRSHSEGVHVAVVGLTVVEDYITRFYLRAVNCLVAHGLSNETIELANHRVSSVRVDIPLTKCVCNLTKPGAATDELRVHIIVSDDVHIVPPTVEQIVVELVVHAHIKDVHCGQVASSR